MAVRLPMLRTGKLASGKEADMARRGEGKTRAPRAQQAERPGAGKVTLRLGSELARRLAVVAAARSMTQSDLVTELVEPYLRRWRVPNGPEVPAGRAAEPEQLEQPAAPRLAL